MSTTMTTLPAPALTAALEARVLVLNKSFQPIAVTRAARAFGLLCSGAARALDREFRSFDLSSWQELAAEVGDDVIHTPRMVLKVPRVVVLQAYDRMPKRQIRFSRQNIYLRDNFTCQYCSRQFARAQLNLDHVVPRSQGGRTSWENVVCSCVRCNLNKGGRTPAQAGLQLLSQPKRPSWSSLAKPSSSSPVPYAEWLPFIDPVAASYWNAELEDD